MLFEDNNIIYGKTYGIQPEILLIGGSTGNSYMIFLNCIFSRDHIVMLGLVSTPKQFNGAKNEWRRAITLAKNFLFLL